MTRKMITKFFKNIIGMSIPTKTVDIKEQDDKSKVAAKRKLSRAKAADLKLTPKELANKRKEPWVDVIDFKVNQDNIRNGVYELDWNDNFIVQLRNAGYGFDGDPDEEIVGRWFRDICINIAVDIGNDSVNNRSANYINVTKLSDGKSIVS